MPPAGPGRAIVRVRGNHSLRSDVPALGAAVEAWLAEVIGSRVER
jgi:hypothetical protein